MYTLSDPAPAPQSLEQRWMPTQIHLQKFAYWGGMHRSRVKDVTWEVRSHHGLQHAQESRGRVTRRSREQGPTSQREAHRELPWVVRSCLQTFPKLSHKARSRGSLRHSAALSWGSLFSSHSFHRSVSSSKEPWLPPARYSPYSLNKALSSLGQFFRSSPCAPQGFSSCLWRSWTISVLFNVFYVISPSFPPPPVKFYAGPNTSDPWQLSHSGWSRDRDLAQTLWKAALPGITVGNPEHDVLWGPGLCLGSHPPGKSSFMWAAPHAGPEKERDKRMRTNTQAETRKRGQDQPSSNGHDLNPRLPQREQTPGWRCQREAEVSCSRQLSGQTVTPQRAPMALNQQAAKTNKLLFTLGFGLYTVVKGRKRKWPRQQAEL